MQQPPIEFGHEEENCAIRLVQAGLNEDLGGRGDLTSLALVPDRLLSAASLVARQPGVIAGLEVAKLVFWTLGQICPACGALMNQRKGKRGLFLGCSAYPVCRTSQAIDPEGVTFECRVADGMRVAAGQAVARVHGPLRALLMCERLALNFLQRLSGIATLTRRYQDAVSDLACAIYDTRKTTPGWRVLEKYAVRAGGGSNHRMGLYDGVLIKDNHLVAWHLGAGKASLAEAVRTARAAVPAGVPVELEVDSIAQLEEALPGRPDIVLLDNMSVADMGAAVALRDRSEPRFLLEASGGISLDTVRAIAQTGVDRISVGALTHSAAALDLGLDFEDPRA